MSLEIVAHLLQELYNYMENLVSIPLDSNNGREYYIFYSHS